MPLTPSQLKRYWLELRAVMGSARVSRADSGVPPESSVADFRAAFHAQHNLPSSTKQFTRQHFDAFLAACRAITEPANLKPQLRALNQPKARLLHKILVEQAAMLNALKNEQELTEKTEKAGPVRLGPPFPPLPPVHRSGLETILHICADKFHGRKPADLSAPSSHSGLSTPGSTLRTRKAPLHHFAHHQRTAPKTRLDPMRTPLGRRPRPDLQMRPMRQTPLP